jgi:hypothetical protein
MINEKLNKKGQLGKLISSFPIMLLVFIIMGVFIFISASVSLANVGKETPVFAEEIVTQDDLMLKMINVDMGDGKMQQMKVIDAAKKVYDETIEALSLNQQLELLLNDYNNRLFIYWDDKQNPVNDGLNDRFNFIRRDGETVNIQGIVGGKVGPESRYVDAGVVRSTSFLTYKDGTEKRIYIDYYYGKELK